MTKIFTVTKALQDAGLPYSAIEQATVGYVYGKTPVLQNTVHIVVLCMHSRDYKCKEGDGT